MSIYDRDHVKDHPFDRRMTSRRRMDRQGSVWKEAILMAIFLALVVGGVALWDRIPAPQRDIQTDKVVP